MIEVCKYKSINSDYWPTNCRNTSVQSQHDLVKMYIFLSVATT